MLAATMWLTYVAHVAPLHDPHMSGDVAGHVLESSMQGNMAGYLIHIGLPSCVDVLC